MLPSKISNTKVKNVLEKKNTKPFKTLDLKRVTCNKKEFRMSRNLKKSCVKT